MSASLRNRLDRIEQRCGDPWESELIEKIQNMTDEELEARFIQVMKEIRDWDSFRNHCKSIGRPELYEYYRHRWERYQETGSIKTTEEIAEKIRLQAFYKKAQIGGKHDHQSPCD